MNVRTEVRNVERAWPGWCDLRAAVTWFESVVGDYVRCLACGQILDGQCLTWPSREEVRA